MTNQLKQGLSKIVKITTFYDRRVERVVYDGLTTVTAERLCRELNERYSKASVVSFLTASVTYEVRDSEETEIGMIKAIPTYEVKDN